MNVGQLIEELRRYPPTKPVRVVLVSVTYPDDDDAELELCDLDASEADEVCNMGSHILIRSK